MAYIENQQLSKQKNAFFKFHCLVIIIIIIVVVVSTIIIIIIIIIIQ